MDGPAEKTKSVIDELPEDIAADDADMTSRVMDLYFLAEGKRTPEDTEAFGIVLERMAYAADTEKRADIANRLAFSEDAPARLMRRLAFDCITVARPVLQYSDCLSESDLITLARKLEQDYLHAISHRRKLTPPVTDVLVDRGNSKVRVSVTQNSGAAFTGETLQRLGEMAEHDAELRFSLGLRPELNPSMFDRLKTFVAGQLLVPVEDEHTLRGKPAEASKTSEQKATAKPAAETPKPSGQPQAEDNEEPAPVYDPVRDSHASEKNLVKLAKGEMLQETITCMSKLTGMERDMVEHCLLRAELSALMVLCKANGFANTTFTVLLKLRQKHSEDGTVIDVKSMLYRYEAMQSHTAKRIIQYANKKNG